MIPHASRTAPPSRSQSLGASSDDHSTETLVRNLRTPNHATQIHFLYENDGKEADDYLHNPYHEKMGTRGDGDGKGLRTLSSEEMSACREQRSFALLSCRGLINIFVLLLITVALVGLFAVYPVFTEVWTRTHSTALFGWNLGGRSRRVAPTSALIHHAS